MVKDNDEIQRVRIHWEGDSKETLARFPDAVRADLGFSLWQLQQGRVPDSATRRMESVGPGVWELKEQGQRAWYRIIYLARIDDVIYVLHSFEKQGRRTDRRDLEIAQDRLKRVQDRIREQKRNAKKPK